MESNFTCIIVDDEPKMALLLERCLKNLYKNIDVLAIYNKWHTALPFLREDNYDILFLDISMPGKSGIDLLALLPSIKAEVIFVTAHAEFAFKALQFAPTGYVLKPIDDNDLALAVNKAIERTTFKKLAKRHTEMPAGIKIGIPSSDGIDYIQVEDIIYLEAKNKHTLVYTKETCITSSYNLTKLKSLLEQHFFLLVHRSFIVNLNYVKRYDANRSIILINGAEVPLARSYRDDFLDKFEKVTKTD